MKHLILAILMTTFTQGLYAISVQRIFADLENFSFIEDKGEAKARDLYIEIGNRGGERSSRPREAVAQELFIFRNGDDLEIDTSLTTIVWKGIPRWLTVDLYLKGKDVEAKLGYISGHSIRAKELQVTKPALGDAKIQNLNLECYLTTGMESQFENLLGQCLSKGKLTGGVFEIPTLKDFLAREVLEQPEMAENLRELGRNLQLTLTDNKYSLDIATFFMNIHLRSNGTVHFDEAKRMATVKIDVIRFGKLNITKMAFSVLRDVLTTEGVRVAQPYIYIQL